MAKRWFTTGDRWLINETNTYCFGKIAVFNLFWLHCTPDILLGSCSSISLTSTLVILCSKSSRMHFVVHTTSNDYCTNQLVQTFKVHHLNHKRVETSVLYRRWSPHQCPVFCTERTVSDSCPTNTIAALCPVRIESLSLQASWSWEYSLGYRSLHYNATKLLAYSIAICSTTTSGHLHKSDALKSRWENQSTIQFGMHKYRNWLFLAREWVLSANEDF